MPTSASVLLLGKLLPTTTPARAAAVAICVLAMSFEISSTRSCALRDDNCAVLLLLLWSGSAWAGLRSSEGGDSEVGVWEVEASEKGVDLGSGSSARKHKSGEQCGVVFLFPFRHTQRGMKGNRLT